MAERAIAAGHSVDQFRAEAFSYLPQATPLVPYEAPLGEVKSRDWQKYSISRAILGQLSGKQDGIEGEFNREISLKHGRKPEGIFIPDQAFRNHVAGTATLGGFLVQNTVASNEFIELLRNRSQVINLGARVTSTQRADVHPATERSRHGELVRGDRGFYVERNEFHEPNPYAKGDHIAATVFQAVAFDRQSEH